jgi:transcriptional regulator with XRE-family HTH domain
MSTATHARAPAAEAGRATASRARARDRRGEVPPQEQARLRDTFGRLLWASRLQADLTQAQLTALAGVGPRTIEKLERGVVRPSDSMCRKLSRALLRHADEVTQAVLAVRLQDAAGDSLRVWNRRRPISKKIIRAEVAAAERIEADRERARQAQQAEIDHWAALLAAEPAPVVPDPFASPSGRRPQVRRSRRE